MDSNGDNRVAVVGLGALFPDAMNVEQFWQNIVQKKVSIRELPEELLESEVFYRPELLGSINKQDKTTTNIAAYIEGLEYQTTRKYRIPPSVTEHMDENQHAALYTADQALESHSLENVGKDRIGVILGNGMVGTAYGNALVRVQFQLIEHFLKEHPDFTKLPSKEQEDIIEYVRANALKDSIPITEDSAPGVLPNIQAARVANVYDFHGPSFTVDAACASALAAIIKGMQGLRLNEVDAVLCGGADMPLRQLGFIYFSALNALSARGSFPFDKRADGFVMGQGSGTVILKRLSDAVAQGDKIHAVITGYGEGSDGKGKYIAAPNYEWQARTIEKACRMSGYPVDTIELLEAHGTATIVGDVVEVDALKSAFSRMGSKGKQYCGLTSVKSNIGHLKSAAGIAGFIKAVLAIENKTLPPTASFQEINPKLQLEDSPFYVLDEAREWHGKKEHPRRANVSAFGFGGADYHLTLEEFREEDYRERVRVGYTAEATTAVPRDSSPQVYAGAPQSSGTAIATFSGKSVADLDAAVEAFSAKVQERPEISFAEHVRLHNHSVGAEKKAKLAILASSLEELQSKQGFFQKSREKLDPELFKAKQIYFKESPPVKPSEVAVMFPGQASQYLHMFRNVYEELDGVRSWYDRADAYWFSRYGRTVTSLLYPTDLPEEEAFQRLTETQNVHPSIFITSFALYDLLAKLGLEAGFMIGHSLGEITALAASGKMEFSDALQLVGERGHAFHDAQLPDTGKMISVMGSLEQAEELIRESGLEVVIANINGLRQIIVAGASPEIEKFKKFLDGKKLNNKILSVSHAFHSPVIKPVAETFYGKIKQTRFRKSTSKVMMNHSGDYYPNSPKALERIPELLREQILNPVNFVRSVQKLYQDGVRLFVEIGPGSILSNVVKEILADKEISVATSNHKKADDLQSLLGLWANLFAEGFGLEQLPLRRSPLSTEVPVLARAAEAKDAPPVQPAADSVRPEPVSAGKRETVVYSGLSIGLPGSYKEVFRDDNFQQVFAGHNFIERVTDDERQKLVDLQVTKLVKDERGPSFKLLSSLEEVIQLAGKIGKLDMIADFSVDEKDAQNMTSCIAMGVAAGYEALKDAQIPLVREYVRTSTGRMLPTKLSLPEEMQEETGVIFANGFPMIDPVIREVSRHLSYHLGSKTRREMIEFYQTLIGRVKDHETSKLLTDWYTLYYGRLSDMKGEEEVYQFNYNFMYQISAQANNRLASLINAKGPNFQMNAACSSTSNAITIAEDFIRSGRVKRMIVVGADDPTSSTNFPVLGAGFLATGAATNEGDLYTAAVPFDRRRNGMIISAGAVGVVLETKEEVEKRGVMEVVQVLGTHSFNTAKHPSQIDCDQFGHELQRFIGKIEREHGLDREKLAKQLIYLSHETYTPPRGGCSQTEAEALREAFGESSSKEIIIGNTKGMTGHTMGAALEDAVAAKSLQYGKVPPVVNLTDRDPMFTSLNLAGVGSHDRIYALKMSAGFGSQGHFALLRRAAVGDRRITDEAKYRGWLKSISSDENPETEHLGRLYVLKDRKTVVRSEPGAVPVQKPATTPAPPKEEPVPEVVADKSAISNEIITLISEVTKYPPEMLEPDMEIDADLGISKENQEKILKSLVEKYGINPQGKTLSDYETIGKLIGAVQRKGNGQRTVSQQPASAQAPAAASLAQPAAGTTVDKETITVETLKVFAEVTKYPEDMLELGMEMEADLGIDTVKQATILAKLGEKYRMERDESIQLSNYPTIGHIVDLVYERAGGATAAPGEAAPPEVKPEPVAEAEPAPAQPPAEPPPGGSHSKEEVQAETLKVFSEVTKYPEDMLELGMEMEADLGIDTVKQATILAKLGEKYRMERDESIQLSNYPTIGHIVDLVYERAGKGMQPPSEAVQPAPAGEAGTESASSSAATPAPQSAGTAVARESVEISPEPAVTASEPEPGVPTPARGFDKDEIRAETLKVFSEVTKYPEDMLELGMEMEADLGIDTVKQATILAKLGEKYRLERDESIQLSNYPTIGHIVDLIHERAGRATTPPTEAPAAEPTVEVQAGPEAEELPPVEESHLTRQIVVQFEVPLGEKDFDLTGKNVWLMGDDEEFLKKMVPVFKGKSANVEVYIYPGTTSEAEIQKEIKEFAEGKNVDVIVDCTHVGQSVVFSQLSGEEAETLLHRSSTARFVVYKQLANDQARTARIVCLTSIDGNMGCDPSALSVPDPTYGSLIGFYKGLRKELPESRVKIIDFSPRAYAEEFDACAEHLIAEIQSAGTGVEITYGRGRRKVLKILEREASAKTRLTFTEKDTILITGGGTGIASRALLELARRYPANFIIVDLNPIPEDIQSLARLDEAGLEQLRKNIRQELRKDHLKVTPVMVNRKFDAITKAIQIYRNLEQVRGLGREVEYIASDVRDGKRLGEGLERARRAVGPVTAIIHAAGLDKSHLIDQKSVEEFQTVFSVKAVGAANLMALCKDDPLRLVVSFSSISARFGNAAQLDYCAANSFLNYWGATMGHGRKDLHAISIMWSGWKDVGIAWRNDFVRERSEEMGLNFIEVHEGIAALIREIETKTDDLQVVLHRGLGGFVEKGLAVTEIGDLPLIDRITRNRDDEVRAYRMFSVGRDALIDQHRLGKVPILPAVAYSELAAEYFALRTGKKGPFLLRNLTFENAFKLFRERPRELFIEGRPGDGKDVWEIQIKSDFRLPKSTLVQTVLHSRSIVSSEIPDHSDMDPEKWEKPAAEDLITLSAEESLMLIEEKGPEQRIILGPLYNDTVRDPASKEPVLIYPTSTIYPTYFPQEQLTNQKYPLEESLVNPCFLDSIYQACAAHLLVNKKRVYLPWEVKELGIVNPPKKPGLYKSYTRVVEDSDELVVFHVVMVDGEGEVCYFARDASFRKINL
jgi:acyl transferase domain-containing protein/short-subunit dehydrogenase/acyl carrier protein